MGDNSIYIDNEEIQSRINTEGGNVHFSIDNRQRHLEWMSLDHNRVWSGASGYVPWGQYARGMLQLEETGECDMKSEDLHVHISLGEGGVVHEIRINDKYKRSAGAYGSDLNVMTMGRLNLEMLKAIV